MVIPSYNRAHTIGRALESVMEQSFKDLEIIVVDDASTDNTQNVVKKFPKVRYIRHKSNMGVSAARNTGITASKGRFIAFLDSDDFWREDKLERQLETMLNNGTKWSYTRIVFVDENLKKIREQKAEASGFVLTKLLEKNIIGPPSSVIVERNVLKKCGLFNRNLWYREDYHMWIRIASKYEVSPVDLPLTYQLVHSGERLSHNYRNRIKGFMQVLKAFEPEFKKNRKALARQLYELGKLHLRIGEKETASDYFKRAFLTYPNWNAFHKWLTTA